MKEKKSIEYAKKNAVVLIVGPKLEYSILK